jgi:hypothetical protein
MKTKFRALMFFLVMISGGNAYAGLPVYDGAALTNNIASWAVQAQSMASQLGELKKQYDTMQQQYQQLQQTYNSISGIRNMGRRKDSFVNE